MKNRGAKTTVFRAFFIAVTLLALFHTFFHVAVYGTGVTGAMQNGISGFVVSKEVISQNLNDTNSAVPGFSLMFIVGEWVFLLCSFVLTVFKNGAEAKNERGINISSISKRIKSSTSTDLDVLYELLKEKKRVKVSAVMKAFDLEEEMAMNWCKILESGNLAVIEYSRVGEPIIELKE
jgi:hypothetical protein